jgi:hypothetical protein
MRTLAAALTCMVTRTVRPRPRPRTEARRMRATRARRRAAAREPSVARNSAEIEVTGPTASEHLGAVPQAPRQRTNREPEPGAATSVSRLPKVRSTVHRLPQSSDPLRTEPAPSPTLRT